MSTLSIGKLARLEWRHSSSRPALAMALLGLVALPGSHLLLSLVPQRVIDFMRRGFVLEDFGSVLLLNDLMAVYFPTFFVGLIGALHVILLAREEHRLEILLVKPISTADFVTARSLPVLIRILGVGVSLSFACGLVTALHPGVEDAVSALGAIGGGLSLTALAMVLVALLMLIFVKLRDPFHALLVASFAWLMTTMPAAVLLYRPDAFSSHETLRETIVMSTLIWHQGEIAWLGWAFLALAIPLSLALVRLSGRLLASADSD